MKMNKTLIFCSILCGSFSSFAQDFQLKSEDSESIRLEHRFKEKTFQYKEINGQSAVDFAKTFKVLTDEQGAPALPLFHQTIQLPEKGNPVIEVTYDAITIFENVVKHAEQEWNVGAGADTNIFVCACGRARETWIDHDHFRACFLGVKHVQQRHWVCFSGV